MAIEVVCSGALDQMLSHQNWLVGLCLKENLEEQDLVEAPGVSKIEEYYRLLVCLT